MWKWFCEVTAGFSLSVYVCAVVCHVWYTHWALSHRFPRSQRNRVAPNKQSHVKREYKRAIGKCRGDAKEACLAAHIRRRRWRRERMAASSCELASSIDEALGRGTFLRAAEGLQWAFVSGLYCAWQRKKCPQTVKINLERMNLLFRTYTLYPAEHHRGFCKRCVYSRPSWYYAQTRLEI